MTIENFDTDQMSNLQIIDLLSLSYQAANGQRSMLAEYEGLVGMSSGELVEAVRNRLVERELSVEDAARLSGVSELTVKRWFETDGSLAGGPKAKMAGLCLLLSLDGDDADDSRPAGLVGAALSTLRRGPSEDASALREEPLGVVLSAFDVAGVMAIALYSAIRAECSDTDSDEHRSPES